MNIRPSRRPRPVFFSPSEIRIAITISQISGLEKLASASATAPLDVSDVTFASETMTIAISAMTPIGITFRMMATIVVRKIASIAQPLGSSPAGVGTASSPSRTAVVTSAGTMRNGTAFRR